MKLYYEPEGRWQVPGQQSKHAAKVALPTAPIDMASWLNARRVLGLPLETDELADELAEQEGNRRGYERPPQTEPTMPDPAAVARCPACNRSHRAAELLARSGDIDAIGGWILEQPGWILERLFATIGARIRDFVKGRADE